MKDNLLMDFEKEKVFFIGKMEQDGKELLKIMKWMEKVNIMIKKKVFLSHIKMVLLLSKS